MSAGSVAAVNDDEAIRWSENKSSFWSVVIAPWILIQENNTNSL